MVGGILCQNAAENKEAFSGRLDVQEWEEPRGTPRPPCSGGGATLPSCVWFLQLWPIAQLDIKRNGVEFIQY